MTMHAVSTAQPYPEQDSVPHHIAIVMDGNGRWAKKRFLPRLAGHRQGAEDIDLKLTSQLRVVNQLDGPRLGIPGVVDQAGEL